METLNGLSVFVRVVDTGGFSAAARDLGMSKSAVSKQVAKLENRLGVRLLNRTTRRLSATEAGTVFYERRRASSPTSKMPKMQSAPCTTKPGAT